MRLAVLALLVASTAHAGARGDLDLEASASASRTWLDLPVNDGRTQGGVAVGFGLRVSPDVALSLRGTVDAGEGPTTMTAIGVQARYDHGRYFAGLGPAIAHVRGPADPSRAFATMPPTIDALAAVLDVRAGIRLAPVYIALEVRPLVAFANESVDEAATLGAAFHAGIAVGVAY